MNQVKLHAKQDLLEALYNNSEVIKSYGVNCLGVFGSFMKGTFNDKSDVDLLVDFVPEKKSFDNFMELSFFLEELLGRNVELIIPPSLSKFIDLYILKELQHVNL